MAIISSPINQEMNDARNVVRSESGIGGGKKTISRIEEAKEELIKFIFNHSSWVECGTL